MFVVCQIAAVKKLLDKATINGIAELKIINRAGLNPANPDLKTVS